MSLISRASASASRVSWRSSASSSAIKIVIGKCVLLMVFFGGLSGRQRDDKRRAQSFQTICHDQTAMAIRNFTADGQADAGAFVFSFRVQALEDRENLLGEFLLE